MLLRRLLAPTALLAVVLTLGLMAMACEEEEATPTPGRTPAAGAATTPAGPTVEIVSPSAGATLPAGDIRVEVRVSGLQVVEPTLTPVPGQGHVHFYILRPDQQVPTTPGQPAVTAQGTYHATATTTHTWTNVQPGTYKLAVQLVQNNHTPLQPPVVREITVTVR
ncbi:MAG TPA: DUF4399 domain-containing protein [Dehalococcoidia bacterium]|nr:DUF4399 domain-containing protein [Dehalococcoidia bacterium]